MLQYSSNCCCIGGRAGGSHCKLGLLPFMRRGFSAIDIAMVKLGYV
jgi:hypothetical protein